jgi:phosphoesterase RecJ-like protein
MNSQSISALKKILSTPQKISLVTHRNPDGDAIGSSLAMQHYLKSKGHIVQTVLPNEAPAFLQWLPGAETTLKFDKQNQQSKKAILESNILFILDFNALHRVGETMQVVLESYAGTFVMIDHHQQPEPVSEFVYSDTSICATCQMVYHFIDMLGDLNSIDAAIASCLYTGIMTDTGSFRFSSTTALTHKVVADLIAKGADNAMIHDRVFNTNSSSRLELMGIALTNMVVLQESHTAYMTLSVTELESCNYQKGDTEGLVNYGLSLKGIYMSAIFIEDSDQNIVKISFRSKGHFSVNQFSRNHFQGGGHDNAAGGRSTSSLETTVERFVSLLPTYKEALAESYES